VLRSALDGLNVRPNSNVLVGYETADDAGVYRLDDDRALVQTVDFFTPVVDDPFTYGQIAAANSLSDIYAMGGVPQVALCLVGFPQEKLESAVLHDILRGGTDKMDEARVAVIGGHSVQDPEMKFGYCVSGFVNPQRIYTNRKAKAGDALVLTKPLGTGIIATAVKFNKATTLVSEAAIQWMVKLNAGAVDCMAGFEIHAVTDITGYGLVGHAFEMAQGSQKTLVFNRGEIPFMEGAEELIRRGMEPGGIESNRQYVGEAVEWGGLEKLQQTLMLDPQTSGGLLISVADEDAPELIHELEASGFLGRNVGHVSELEAISIRVE